MANFYGQFIGFGAGGVAVASWFNQGTQYGFCSGGETRQDTVDKFSFTSDGDAADHCDLHNNIAYGCGQSSSTHGYCSGGYPTLDMTQKFSFSSTSDGTDVGNLTLGRYYGAGTSSETYGYTIGGAWVDYNPVYDVTIDKFLFSSDGNSVDSGDLDTGHGSGAGCSSSTYGYVAGGNVPASIDNIQKFLFAAGTQNATDVGNIARGNFHGSTGQNSETYGYSTGGSPYATTDACQKYSFSSDGDSVAVGDTLGSHLNNAGCSSTTNGYHFAGAGGGNGNMIQKFSFSSDGDSQDIGNLTGATAYCNGHHF